MDLMTLKMVLVVFGAMFLLMTQLFMGLSFISLSKKKYERNAKKTSHLNKGGFAFRIQSKLNTVLSGVVRHRRNAGSTPIKSEDQKGMPPEQG